MASELLERAGWRGREEIKKMVQVDAENSDTKTICPPGRKGKDFPLEKRKALRQMIIKH